MSPADGSNRFEQALRLIDAANAEDPARLTHAGASHSKEMLHARMASDWVRRLRPDASEALLLATRAHHIRRWQMPRSTFPATRQGYLQWRAKLQRFHADEAASILKECGYEDADIARVKDLIRKRGLTPDPGNRDPEAQTLEDALCLVFLETQLDELAQRVEHERMVNLLRTTWGKMSEAGHAKAMELELSDAGRELVRQALEAPAGNPPGRSAER
ncbi:MAG: DUF4202 domain-containing protein [Chloroflexi bacterium]|nr:DUF4202 domain-containing protein [Chloroflexota bacterium]